MTEREAYRRMRDESRRLRRPIREITQAVLLVETLTQERPGLLTPEVKDLD
jgi:AmiR/NasT family two-component response regulator